MFKLPDQYLSITVVNRTLFNWREIEILGWAQKDEPGLLI